LVVTCFFLFTSTPNMILLCHEHNACWRYHVLVWGFTPPHSSLRLSGLDTYNDICYYLGRLKQTGVCEMAIGALAFCVFWLCLALFDIFFGLGIFQEGIPYCGLLCEWGVMDSPEVTVKIVHPT